MQGALRVPRCQGWPLRGSRETDQPTRLGSDSGTSEAVSRPHLGYFISNDL